MVLDKNFIKQPLCIVVCCIFYNKRILLLKRHKEPYKGLWSLPGGKIELDEYPTQAIYREIKEETGITLLDVQFKGLVCEKIVEESTLYNHIIHIFSSTAVDQDINPSMEGELCWFNIDNIHLHAKEIILSDYKIIQNVSSSVSPGIYNCLIEKIDKSYILHEFLNINKFIF